jgi:hypothetical protein
MSYVIVGMIFVLMFWLGTRKKSNGTGSFFGKLIGGTGTGLGPNRPK